MIVKGKEKTAKDKLTEEQSHLLSNIGLVLYILFRETSENQSLDDIVQSQVFDAIDEYSLRISSKKYHKHILLVCDGLDETSLEYGQILEIINGKKYPNIRCIVTCRPHASLGMSLTADAEIRLKGFSKDQARHYVDVYFIQMHPVNTKIAEQASNKLWHEIESSPDLQEMAINPSMLQLLCKLFHVNGKIAKDRATVFQDYTNYLLQQYHIKTQKKEASERSLKNFYEDTLQKVGRLALQGLKQNHFQLVFSRDFVESVAGKVMFEIGFITELPSYRNEKPKVQFQHKTHQEYLAAYFIVNSPEDVGMKYLMEFCSTSKSLMGSQIILTFIIAMSKEMGKLVQKQVKELVSSWASEDDVSPKDRTSFLLAMLKENRSLVFPLPKEVDINLREHETNIGWIEWFLQFFGRKDTLEQFFDFDNRGVQKISIVLGEKYRLQLMGRFRESSLVECVINFQKRVSRDDQNHLKDLIEHNQKLESISMTKLNTQGVIDIFNQKLLISSLEKSNIKVIKIHESEFKLNTYTSDALIHVPNHIALDLSGNKLTDQSGCKHLVIKAAHQRVVMQDCGIIIDKEIAEVISQLPEQANLDLSGNTVTKMDSSLLCHVIPVISNKSIDLSGLGVFIDDNVAQALCSLDKELKVDLSGNHITDKSVCITLIHKAATMKSLSLCNCGIKIDRKIAEAVSRLPDHTQLDLSGNKVTYKSACIQLIHKAVTMKSLNIHDCMSNGGMKIDTQIAKALSKLPDHTQLDLSGNQVTDKSACITLIHKAVTMKSLSLCNCGIKIDTEIAKAVSSLSDHTQLDLSGNQVTNKSACITLIHKAATMKSLNIHNCMFNCGIQIDAKIAEAVSRLPDHTQLDLSGNQVTDKSACITLIHKAANVKSLSVCDCGIQIDAEIAEAVSRLPEHTQLDLSGNQVTDNSACISLIHKAATMKSLNIHNCMFNCGIQIDAEIAEAVSRLPGHTHLDLSGNQVTDKSACITLIHKAATMKSLNIHNCVSNCGIQIDKEIAFAVSRLPEHTQLDLSGNQVTDKSACITLIHKAATMKKFSLCNCGIKIDTEIAEAVSRLPDHTQLDLSGNQVTDKSACITLIHKAATMKSFSLCNCGIKIDTEIAEAVSRLPDHTQLDLSGNQVTDKSACITLIHKAATMKSLSVHNCMSNCAIQIDKKIAKAVSRLPDHTQLDLSGNQVTDKSACITLIHKAATMKSLSLCNCGIKIDTEIAEAVSRLPDHTQLDLSGNQVTDKSACITLIHKAATMKSLNVHDCMSNCGIKIDKKIAKAVSRLPGHTHLDLSGNQATDKSACITLIHKAATMKSLNIHNCMSTCGIKIDTKIAEAVSRLPDHTQLDLSGNQVTDKSACITLIHKAGTMKSLNIHNCMSKSGIRIDTEIAKAIYRLSDHTQLHLSGNQVTGKSACITLIHKAATMKSLNIHDCMSNCGIKIDTEIAKAVSRLPDHTHLDLSGNQVTGKSACITLIHKVATMKSLRICNCGIQIDIEIAEAVSRLPDHTQLDLSGNQVTDKSVCITLIHKAATMKSLSICNCGIKIDTEIAEAVSRLPDHIQLDLSGNQVTDKSACITLIHKAATMKSLSICNCGIKIDTEIAEAVSRLPDHTQLDLSGNDITEMEPYLLSRILSYMTRQERVNIEAWGITVDEDIVRALSKLSKLQTLIINIGGYRNNNELTPRASSEIPHTVSSMPHLQDLHLYNCNISNDAMVALTDSLCKHCPLLWELSLRYNHLSSGVWEVVEHIQQMKNLRKLWLGRNPCTKDDKQSDKIETTLHRSNPGLDVWLY